MATESFTNTNGTELTTHSASWILGNAVASDFIIDTNALRTPFSRNVALNEYYTGTFNADQYSEATITQIGSVDQYMGVCVRANAGDNYSLVVGDGEYLVWKLINYSTYTQLAFGAATVAVNDIVRLEVVGSTLTAKVGSTTVYTGTDTAITSGAPGVAGQGSAVSGTYTLIDNWVGANLPLPAQAKFRWRKDNGSETTATWASSENNNVVAPLG